MTRLSFAIAMAGLFVVVLVASAPAHLLGRLLPPEQIVMQGFSGTLWRGRALRCLVNAGHGHVQLGAVSWRLRPWSLLTLSPSLDIRSAWGRQQIDGQVTVMGSQRLRLEAFEAQLSARLLNEFTPFAVNGWLSAQLDLLQLENGLPVAGRGRLVWQQAGWLSPQGLRPLGSYAMDFEQPEDKPLLGQLLSLSGPVLAEGSVQLDGRAYQVDIMVRSETGLEPQLQQSLALFGQAVDDGYRVRLNAEFQAPDGSSN